MLGKIKCAFGKHYPASPWPDRAFAFQLSFKGNGPLLIQNVYVCKRCGVLLMEKANESRKTINGGS